VLFRFAIALAAKGETLLNIQTLIRPGEYRDSVALMLIARELGTLAGVSDVSVVMGTPANKSILQQAGLLTAQAQTASPTI